MKTNIKRLLSYTLRYKFSFVISIIGFITFAAADIAAVEWIRRVIQFINDSSAVNHNLIALALVLIASVFANSVTSVALLLKLANPEPARPL